MAIRIVHHYLMGGWGLEDAETPGCCWQAWSPSSSRPGLASGRNRQQEPTPDPGPRTPDFE